MNEPKSTSMSVLTSTVVRGHSPAAIRRARATARAFTRSLTPAPDPEVADALLLVVSELVTNAVRHGGGQYVLDLSTGPDAMTVKVSDPSPALPRERAPDLEGDGGGFGWHMIRDFARSVTVTPGPGRGKTVHARLALRPLPRHTTDAR